MLPDITNYIPDPNNGRPIANGQVYFFIDGYTPPTNINDVNQAYVAEVTAGGAVLPQPIYTTQGGVLRTGSLSNMPQVSVSTLVKRVAVYDKCGALIYSTAYNGIGAFVEVDALAATDSDVLVGGVEAGRIVETLDLIGVTQGYLKTEVVYVKDLGITNGSDTDSRSLIFGQAKKVFVPKGFTFRCNLLPDDDVLKFVGEGSFTTTDPFGNTHTYDIGLANAISPVTASGLLNRAVKLDQNIIVGFIGDSVTDGADGTGWTPNPVAGGVLSSTNYDHDANGGLNGYSANFRKFSNMLGGLSGKIFTANASSTGQRLIDGWAYRNFDHGFFKNAAYGNAAPDIVYITMGINDVSILTSDAQFELYLYKFEQLVKKIKGYGGKCGLITVNSNTAAFNDTESALKKVLHSKFADVDYINLGDSLAKFSSNSLSTLSTLYTDGALSLDLTHPNNIGHRFLGLELAYRTMDSSAMPVKDGTIFKPLAGSFMRVIGNTSNARYFPQTYDALINKPWQDNDPGTGYCAISNENVYVDYHVYVTEKGIRANVFETYGNTLTSAKATDYLSVINSTTENLDSIGSGVISLTGYLVTQTKELDYGLNIIRIRYTGNPSLIGVPFLSFNKITEKSSTSFFSKTAITAGTTIGLNGNVIPATDKPLKNRSYSELVTSHTPDFVSGDSILRKDIINILPDTGYTFASYPSVVYGLKLDDFGGQTGYEITATSDITATVTDIFTGAVVKTITTLRPISEWFLVEIDRVNTASVNIKVNGAPIDAVIPYRAGLTAVRAVTDKFWVKVQASREIL